MTIHVRPAGCDRLVAETESAEIEQSAVTVL
jgi:hypothetical protein